MKSITFKSKLPGAESDYRLITTQTGHKFALPICKYEANAKANRFDVKPGHRWDGVDRSSNYEARWFQKSNIRNGEKENYK